MKDKPVEITGVHLRSSGARKDNHIIVAVEMNGKWRDVISEYVGPLEVSISHFIGTIGIRKRGGGEG